MKNIFDITKMTWKEIESLPKEKTILFLTFAPIEEHGLHLPLGVDLFLGETWRDNAMELLLQQNKDLHLLKMPCIPFAQGSIKGFVGNLHLKQHTIFKVAYEVLRNITDWGIKNIVIIASHGEPKHLIAIEEACEKINKRHGVCAISPMGAFFSFDELGIDLNFPEGVKEYLKKYPNDFHAGWIETSSMLDINEKLVKSDFIEFPDTHVDEREMIFPKKVSKKIKGYGHIGFPRVAQKSIGYLLNANTSQYLCDVTLCFYERKNYKIYQHHFLYRMPFMRTNLMRLISKIIVLIIASLVIYWIV